MLVSHGAFLGILIAELLGLDARHAFAVGLAGPSMPNTGTALLTLKGAGVTFAPIPRLTCIALFGWRLTGWCWLRSWLKWGG